MKYHYNELFQKLSINKTDGKQTKQENEVKTPEDQIITTAKILANPPQSPQSTQSTQFIFFNGNASTLPTLSANLKFK